MINAFVVCFSVQVNLPSNANVYLKHGGLRDEYVAAQFHFHWGPDDSHGSEHTYQGQAYPLEVKQPSLVLFRYMSYPAPYWPHMVTTPSLAFLF